MIKISIDSTNKIDGKIDFFLNTLIMLINYNKKQGGSAKTVRSIPASPKTQEKSRTLNMLFLSMLFMACASSNFRGHEIHLVPKGGFGAFLKQCPLSI